MKEGIILSGVGGLYEVRGTDETVYCRARGAFRKEGVRPLLGDRVRYSEEGCLEEILPRKSCMIRPAAANMDQLLFVLARHNPEPSWPVLDRFLLEAGRQKLPVLLCFNKQDLVAEREEEWEEARRAYEQAGYFVTSVSSQQPDSLKPLRERLRGKLTAIAGPSGVGKSSLINALTGESGQEIGELSRKIARGKNTTRHARLLPLKAEEGWIADTPGFTSFATSEWTAEELIDSFAEFEPYKDHCRFRDCRHLSEPGCAVKAAVGEGEIARIRYDSYCCLCQECL